MHVQQSTADPSLQEIFMRSMVLFAIGTMLGLSAFAQASPQSPVDVEIYRLNADLCCERDQPLSRSGQLSTSQWGHKNRFCRHNSDAISQG